MRKYKKNSNGKPLCYYILSTLLKVDGIDEVYVYCSNPDIKEFIPETTKIIIAQRISCVMDSDKIIVMENGQINGFGTHAELLESNEIYRDVYESQQGGSKDFDE